MTSTLQKLVGKLIPGSKDKEVPPAPQPQPAPQKPQNRPMFSGGMTGDRPAVMPRRPPADEPWRITQAFLEAVIRRSGKPVVTPDELAALKQADAEAIELERIESELCRDLYGSATTPSAYQRQFANAEEVAAGEKPTDLKSLQVKSREELALALSVKKSGVHSALIAVSQVAVRIAAEIVPRIQEAARVQADAIEEQERGAHQDWGLPYVPSGIVASLRQAESSLPRFLPTANVPIGRLERHPLLGAVLATAEQTKGKAAK